LPEDLEDRIIVKTLALEGRKHMPYLSNIERRSLAKGIEEGEHRGLVEAIALGLELKFGAQALEHLPRVREIASVQKLRELVVELRTAPALEPFLEALRRH